jgi:ABC-2 type transport system ATP-binding protein
MEISNPITTSGLTRNFGNFTAVDSISLNIRRGEIYGFLGLNGAGKTTTIRMLLGMIRPSAGSVSLFGQKVQPDRRSIWRRVGYLVEATHAYPDLTVLENLEIVRRWRKLDDAGVVTQIMEKLALTPYAGRRAKTLSLGNAQRLGLAKALIHHPDLLVLDEPANGLDPAGIVEIRNLLHDLAENDGVTIFISSHILSEVARLATRIGVVHEGKLIKELGVNELAAQEEPRLAVSVRNKDAALSALEKSGIAASPDGRDSLIITDKATLQSPDKIATILVEAGYPPTRLVVERGDLESYFLELVGRKGALEDGPHVKN